MALLSPPTPSTFPSLQTKRVSRHAPHLLHQVPGKRLSLSVVRAEINGAASVVVPVKFSDPRWVGGTWDLEQFKQGGQTDWDAVIDAVIPWWQWMKRFHLPEAELLNGRAAMVGFFMAYLVDGLTGAGLVDQMGNFFCKTLLFAAVAGVLLIRKNEDLENVKKIIEETTFYDKQWQATWEDQSASAAVQDRSS